MLKMSTQISEDQEMSVKWYCVYATNICYMGEAFTC